MFMNTSTRFHQANDYRSLNSDMTRSLAFKLKMLLSDIVNGDFNHRTKENKSGTGRPWIDVEQISIHGISGYGAVYGFESVNQNFEKLTENDVISAVLYGRGLFATTHPMRNDEFFPAYLTHHISDYQTLDRLKNDLKWMFNLSLAITRKDNEDIPEIVPHCQAKTIMRDAVNAGCKCIVTRLGTEINLRNFAEHGITMNEFNTDTIGYFTAKDRSYLEEIAVCVIQEFLAASFDAGVRWGAYPDTMAPAQAPLSESAPSFEPVVTPPKVEAGELALAV